MFKEIEQELDKIGNINKKDFCINDEFLEIKIYCYKILIFNLYKKILNVNIYFYNFAI